MRDFLKPSQVSFFKLLIFGCLFEPLRVYHDTYDPYPITISRVRVKVFQKELRKLFALIMDVIAIKPLITTIPFVSLNEYLTAFARLPTNNFIKDRLQNVNCIFFKTYYS